MDEMKDQLRQLGEAAERGVPSVSAHDVHRRSDGSKAATEIGALPAPAAPSRAPRRLSPKVLLAAAALLVVVASSVVFVGANDESGPIDVASAIQSPPEFAVPADDNGWEELRQCESRGDYRADTGNSFYGAYQLTRSAWTETIADLRIEDQLVANASLAPPAVQDVVANALYLTSGAAPWPVCGASLRGPMITPLVPQWLVGPDQSLGRAVVYVSPFVSSVRLEEIAAELALEIETLTNNPLRFVDQAEAFAQTQNVYRDNPEALRALEESNVSPRFELPTTLPADATRRITEIDDVFHVFDSTPVEHRGPLRLSIPAIGLEAPVYQSASVANLQRGPTVIVNDNGVLAIGGYGSVEGSVFERLNELRDGDLIVVSTLIRDSGLEVVRRFEVDLGSGDQGPVARNVDDAILWRSNDDQRLVLVADVEGQSQQRLVVRTNAVEPPIAGYPAPDSD